VHASHADRKFVRFADHAEGVCNERLSDASLG